MPKIFTDPEFGPVTVTPRSNARRITLRAKPEGVFVSVPPLTPLFLVRRTLEQYRERLRQHYRNRESRDRLHPGGSWEGPHFRLTVETASGPARQPRLIRVSPEDPADSSADWVWRLVCPADTDFRRPEIRERLRQAVLRALRTSARPLLAARLQDWSRRTGLAFANLRISTARTRWGSCSARRDISLSCFLILLPEHLSDYVILHELTHTVQMNHGPRFHRLLDELTGGRSAALQQELRTFVPPYPESVQKR